MSTPVEQWVWLGRAAHFIGAKDCYFRMATVVGKFLVSTVGDYHPGNSEAEEPIGASPNDLFETMVFPVDGERLCGCCPRVTDWRGLAQRRYGTANEAKRGHMELCRKYADEAANG